MTDDEMDAAMRDALTLKPPPVMIRPPTADEVTAIRNHGRGPSHSERARREELERIALGVYVVPGDKPASP